MVTCNIIHYFRINKDKNIKYLCSCFEINKKSAKTILQGRDYSCEFKVNCVLIAFF